MDFPRQIYIPLTPLVKWLWAKFEGWRQRMAIRKRIADRARCDRLISKKNLKRKKLCDL